MERMLRRINEQAACRASQALHTLTGRHVGVAMRKAAIEKIDDFGLEIDAEERTAGVYLPVAGEVNGACMLALPGDVAFVLSDLVVGRMPHTTQQLSELDKSTLKEIGNILAGNYLTVLADALQITMVGGAPSFSFEMFGAILSQILAQFAQQADEALVVELQLTFAPETLRGYFVLLFDSERLHAIAETLSQVANAVYGAR